MITKPGYDHNRPSHPCWNKDYQAQALRVELADRNLYVFPYRRLAFVRFESGNDHDELHVVLDTHQIHITGKHLRKWRWHFRNLRGLGEGIARPLRLTVG